MLSLHLKDLFDTATTLAKGRAGSSPESIRVALASIEILYGLQMYLYHFGLRLGF